MPNLKPLLPVPARRSGALFIGLNVLRFVSIIALVLVFASNIVTMASDIKAIRTPGASDGDGVTDADGEDEWDCEYYEYSTVPDQTGGPFWSVLNRLFILFECIILVLSEIGVPRRLFELYIPVLGPAHGLGCLGVFQALIAASVLSHYCALFPQVSAWLLFIVGCANSLAGLVWRQKAKERRLVFSWENASSLTPQTRMAHTAWEMVTEKQRPSGPASTYSYSYGTSASASRGYEPARPAPAAGAGQKSNTFHDVPLEQDRDRDRELQRAPSHRSTASGAPLLPSGVGQTLGERFAGVRAGVRSSFGGLGGWGGRKAVGGDSEAGADAEARVGVKISRPLETLPRYAT